MAAAIGSSSCAVLCAGEGTWGARARAPRHAPARSGREAGRGFASARTDGGDTSARRDAATSDMLRGFSVFFSCAPVFLIRRGISGGVVARGSRVLLVTLARPRRVARVLWSRWTCAARIKFSVFAQENAEVYSTVDLDHLRIFNRGWMAEIY
jgi:hypothetical protein